VSQVRTQIKVCVGYIYVDTDQPFNSQRLQVNQCDSKDEALLHERQVLRTEKRRKPCHCRRLIHSSSVAAAMIYFRLELGPAALPICMGIVASGKLNEANPSWKTTSSSSNNFVAVTAIDSGVKLAIQAVTYQV